MSLKTKIPPPIVGLVFAVLIWAISKAIPTTPMLTEQQSLLAAVILLITGFGFAISGMVSFRAASTTVNPLQPDQASALVTSGVYRITRNPMYIGLATVLIGWSTFLGAPLGLVGVVGFMAYIQYFQIIPEEQALVRLFGAEFEAYQASVRRWL